MPDEVRSADLPAGAKVATKDGLVVMLDGGGVHVGERAIEGTFEALDLALDDAGLACVLVRQGSDLALWTIPLSSAGGIGRQRLPRTARRTIGPPVLGKSLRIVLTDAGILAFGLDGKRAWERRGVPSGGVSITADDQVVVADGEAVVSIDPRGRVSTIASLPGAVFVTPPILDASGRLLVADEESLHAYAFDANPDDLKSERAPR